MRRRWPFARGTRGFSVVEVLVAVAIFSFAVMALASSSGLISKQMKIARRDMRLAFAMQSKMEQLIARGYDNLTAGADTVDYFPMTWTVTGTTPKTLVLIARYKTTTGATRADTIITQVAKP